MKILYKGILLLSLFLFNEIKAQNNFWTDAPEATMKTANQKRPIVPNKFRSLSLDTVQLKQFLKTAPMEFTEAARVAAPIMSIPMPDGTVSHFSIVESPIMEPGLASKFPNIKTYSGQGVEDRTATIKIDWTDFGFHAMIFSALTPSISVDPYARGTKTNYISYSKSDLNPKPFIEQGVEVSDEYINNQINQQRTQSGFCFGSQLRTYRLAVACTGEYAVAVGGTTASLLHSAIVTTVNRVDGVYEKEVAIRMVLVANNNLVEFLDATTDPFSGNNNANTLITESQTVITANIGTANFDIGHTFSTGGGGLAGLGVVCNSTQKARGITGSPAPTGDAYDIDYVAHEMGHEFGGNHTFNSGTGSCGGGNRNAATAVEPGSGITIMAYAGICSSTNDLAAHSIPYFHTISQGEIGNYSNNSTGNTCAVNTATGNTPPVVNAGADYTIPAGTPFALTGTATDANGDALTYSWEEIDAGTTTANWNSGSTPYFRSFSPTLSGTRYFPQLSDVASATATIGETLPTFAQALNFRLTARDNRNGGGGVCSDEMVLNITNGFSFAVTSQNSLTSWTGNGSNTATITWDVVGTNVAPFNATNVTILFSADGGLSFPYTLISSTANDGTENIVIPAVNTTKGRIMVKAIGNVFFNVNTTNITVSAAASCVAEGAVIAPTTSVTAPAGNASLNLALSPQYTTAFAPSGNVATTDPSTNLTVFSSSTSACTQYSNIFNYDTYNFTVSVTGSYTFQRTGAGSIYNIYANSYNPSSNCTNFIASNATVDATNALSTSATLTVSLTAGTPYVLVIGVYGANSTTPSTSLPFTYSFAVTSTPVGGAVTTGTGTYTNPGLSYSYSYVMVDNVTNLIKAISSTANLTNTSTYPNGTSYTIYGISYSTSQATTLNSYVGANFSTLTSGIIANPATFCANLSKNTVTVIVQAALPVNFLGLKARKQNKNVLLEWSTASEFNSDYFDLQRSADGTNFSSTIGRLTAAGTSTSVKNYSVTDAQPFATWNYYRVKQVDKDGKIAYSNVAAINFEKEAAVVIVYPNPAKDKLNIEYTSTKSGNVQLQVMDSKGALVLSQTANMVLGRNTNTVNVSTLSKGVYMLRTMDTDGNVNFVKFIKE